MATSVPFQLLTDRTRIRRFDDRDYLQLCSMLSDADVVRHTGFGEPQSVERVRGHLDGWLTSEEVWAAVDRTEGALIGWFMLSTKRFSDPELGFMISKAYWGQGFATEITERLVAFGFRECGASRIVASVWPGNTRSIRVLDKLRMSAYSEPNDTEGLLYYERIRAEADRA